MKKRESLCTAGGNINWDTATMENSMVVSKKFKMELPYRSNNTTSGYLSERNEITILKGYLHSYGHWNIIYTSQDMEAI